MVTVVTDKSQKSRLTGNSEWRTVVCLYKRSMPKHPSPPSPFGKNSRYCRSPPAAFNVGSIELENVCVRELLDGLEVNLAPGLVDVRFRLNQVGPEPNPPVMTSLRSVSRICAFFVAMGWRPRRLPGALWPGSKAQMVSHSEFGDLSEDIDLYQIREEPV